MEISVVTPTFNEADNVERFLRTVSEVESATPARDQEH